MPGHSTKLLLSTQARKESPTQEMITSKVSTKWQPNRGSMSCKQPKERQHDQSYVLLRGYRVGLGIGGHTKRGGTKMGQMHRRYTIVSMTNEHRLSQTCIFSNKSKIPKPRKLVKGKWKPVSINGSSLCMNHSVWPIGTDVTQATAISRQLSPSYLPV